MEEVRRLRERERNVKQMPTRQLCQNAKHTFDSLAAMLIKLLIDHLVTWISVINAKHFKNCEIFLPFFLYKPSVLLLVFLHTFLSHNIHFLGKTFIMDDCCIFVNPISKERCMF